MSKFLIATAALAIVLAPATASAQRSRVVVGKETTISYAANGGLRNWQAGPRGSNIVHVQDRRMRWYQVTLSGPCIRERSSFPLQFRTRNDGQFDRFSQVWSRDRPGAICGVKSIKTSLPPKGQPGYKPPRGSRG